jgi:hypothetical protein
LGNWVKLTDQNPRLGSPLEICEKFSIQGNLNTTATYYPISSDASHSHTIVLPLLPMTLYNSPFTWQDSKVVVKPFDEWQKIWMRCKLCLSVSSEGKRTKVSLEILFSDKRLCSKMKVELMGIDLVVQRVD